MIKVCLLSQVLLRFQPLIWIMRLIRWLIVFMFARVRREQLFQFTSSNHCRQSLQLNEVSRNQMALLQDEAGIFTVLYSIVKTTPLKKLGKYFRPYLKLYWNADQ